MNTPRLPLAIAAALLVAGSLAGCASSSGTPTVSPAPTAPASLPSDPTDGPLIEPVVRSANDLQGASVDLQIGQVLDIDTGSLAVDSYSGEVADPSIATFTPGKVDGGATFNPGVTGLAAGTTTVTMKNSNGGIQNLVFTVVVSAAG